MKKTVLFFILLFVMKIATANLYGGAHPRKIIHTLDGGYAVLTFNNLGGGICPYLVKLDSMGNQEWAKGYPHNSIYYLTGDLAQTIDSGYVITGAFDSDTSLNSVFYSAFLMRLNSSGDSLWTKEFSFGEFGDYGWTINSLPNGNFIFGIYSDGETIDNNFLLLELDPLGIQLQIKVTNPQEPGGSFGIRQILIDLAGNYIVPTSMYCGMVGMRIYALSNSLNDLWNYLECDNVNGTLESLVGNIAIADTGYFLVGGKRPWSAAITPIPPLLEKFDSNGIKLWEKQPQLTIADAYLNMVHPCINGGFIANSDFSLNRFNSNGDTIWTKVYQGTGFSINFFIPRPGGGYVLTGDSLNQTWVNFTDSSGNLLRTGTIDINEFNKETFNCLIYPNPATNFVRMSFQSEHSRKIKIEIMNLLGNKIKSIPEFETNPSQNDYQISLNGLENFSGPLFLKVIEGNHILTNKKFIKLPLK